MVSCTSNNKNENTKQNPVNTDVELPKMRDQIIGEKLGTIQEKETELNTSFNFQIVEEYYFDLNNDGYTDEIIIEKLRDWNDPGDYHRIRVKVLENEYSFFNNYGWVKFNNYILQHTHDFYSANLIKSNYFILKKINNNLLLFAFGYAYASQPGLLSIIRFSKNEIPSLIFNDNYFIYSFDEKNKELRVTQYYKDEIDRNKGNIKNFKFNNGWFVPFVD
jgi:hypothetical protein